MLTHLQPWVVQMCDFGEQQALDAARCRAGGFHACVAELETHAFDMAEQGVRDRPVRPLSLKKRGPKLCNLIKETPCCVELF